MTASFSQQLQYSSAEFVELCGTVLFSPYTPFSSDDPPLHVCVLRCLSTNEMHLPKGQRNLAESRAEAAVRVTREATNIRCELAPVTMETRCSLDRWKSDVADDLKLETVQGEAFYHTQEPMQGTMGIRLVWWYVAVADEWKDFESQKVNGSQHKPVWVALDDVVDVLQSEPDREIVRRAMALVQKQ